MNTAKSMPQSQYGDDSEPEETPKKSRQTVYQMRNIMDNFSPT
jgi:hypothetical protein